MPRKKSWTKRHCCKRTRRPRESPTSATGNAPRCKPPAMEKTWRAATGPRHAYAHARCNKIRTARPRNHCGNASETARSTHKRPLRICLATDTAILRDSVSELSHISYEAGAIGLIQVQDADRSADKAQLELIRAQHQRYLDCVRLFVALGGSPVSTQNEI